MANLSLVLVPAKVLADGRHKIRIAVSHNSETRYIVTDIAVNNARQFHNGQVTGRPDAGMLNMKLRTMLNKYQVRLDNVEYIEGLSCAELVNMLKEGMVDGNMTIGEAFAKMMELTTSKKSTQSVYMTSYRSLLKYISPDFPVRNITRVTVMGYHKSLKGRKLGRMTVNNYMGMLLSIITFSRKIGVVGPNFSPGDAFRKEAVVIRDSWLTVQQIRIIRDYDFGRRRCMAIARDVFMLSYYLGGINLADLADIDFVKSRREIFYQRKKVEGRIDSPVRFDMPNEAMELIKRIPMVNGKIKRSCASRSFICRYMKQMREKIGISNLVFYSARKSFSQHAFELGVSSQVIDYVLGHSPKSSGIIFHYVSVKSEMASEAIRKVIDNLNADLQT